MARKLAPINDLLKKGRKIKIAQEMRDNIKECIDMLVAEPVLAFPDFSKIFIVTTDASQEAIGAVLEQDYENGRRPIAFASRRLTDAEERYSTLERELLAVVWAVDHFRPYVYGRKFVVQTDHKPLQWVSKLRENSARVQRWKEALGQYNFEVKYTEGKKNVVADWLSRAHCVNVTTGEASGSGPSLRQFFRNWNPEGEEATDNESEGGSEGTVSAEERQTNIEEVDDIVVAKKRYIIWVATNQGLPSIRYGRKTKNSLKCTVRAPLGATEETIRKLLEDASVANTTTYLYVGNSVAWTKIAQMWADEKIGQDRRFVRCNNLGEVVTDAQTQQDIVTAHHQGKTNHRGISETLTSLKRKYYWKNMRRMVREIVGKCDVCLQTKYVRRPVETHQEETPTASSPLLTIQVDLFTWGGTTWITLLDTFSKIAMAVPVPNKSAEQVVRAFRQWSQVYGTLDLITTDGGREFRNQQVEELLRGWGTTHHVSTPGRPQGHGGVERLHSTLSDHLRILEASRGITGEEAMQLAVTAYNHSVHRATGYTPFEALFGTTKVGRDAVELAGDEGVVAAVRQLRDTQRRVQKKTWARLVHEKQKRVSKHNLHVKNLPRDLRIGDIVFRQLVSNRTKQPKRFEGPYKVVGIREHNLVTIRSQDNPSRQRTVHREQLRLGVPDVDQDQRGPLEEPGRPAETAVAA